MMIYAELYGNIKKARDKKPLRITKLNMPKTVDIETPTFDMLEIPTDNLKLDKSVTDMLSLAEGTADKITQLGDDILGK